MRYLERRAGNGQLTRARVAIPFPWARSALVCFASYHIRSTALDQNAKPAERVDCAVCLDKSRVAQPADAGGVRRPSDYHKVLLKRLRGLEARLHETVRCIRIARLRRYGARGGAGACRGGRHWMDGQEHLPDPSAAWVVWVSGGSA